MIIMTVETAAPVAIGLIGAGRIGTSLPPPRLRTLDAIHLATALDLGGSVSVLLSYDKLLLEAARAAGLAVACPGAARSASR
jgi:predicted nucleic acid-binding protein